MDKVFKISEKIKPLIEGLTGEEVAEIAAGLIGLAAIRKKNKDGYLAAAELCSDLSDVASSLGMDMRRNAAKQENGK